MTDKRLSKLIPGLRFPLGCWCKFTRLKYEAVCYVCIPIYRYTLRHIPEDWNLNSSFNIFFHTLLNDAFSTANPTHPASRWNWGQLWTGSCEEFGCELMGRNSSVGIATRYGLDCQGIESRWGEIFRTRPDRPWVPPSFLKNGYRISFPGVKRPGGGRGGVALTTETHLAPRLKKG